MLELFLPVPPSTNKLYANVPGKGRVKTSAYKAWIEQAGWEVKRQALGKERFGKKKIVVCYSVPENGRRDLDNYLKAMNDVLKTAGIIDDDKHIYKIVIGRWLGENVRATLYGITA